MSLDNEDTTGNDLQLNPGSHGLNLPSACTIVIIAGKLTENQEQKKVEQLIST